MSLYSRSFKIRGRKYRVNKNTLYSNLLIVLLFTIFINVAMTEEESDALSQSVVTESVTPAVITTQAEIEVPNDTENYAMDYYIQKMYIVNDGRVFKESWYKYLEKQCEKNNLPIQLMLAICSLESGGNPKSVNPSSGATGLFQIMEETHRDLRNTYFKDGTSFDDMKNPYTNIKYACKAMRLYIDGKGGDLYKALHWYGGCARPETKQRYIRDVNKMLDAVAETNIDTIIIKNLI